MSDDGLDSIRRVIQEEAARRGQRVRLTMWDHGDVTRMEADPPRRAMGTKGYLLAEGVEFAPGEIILEVGSGESTTFLATVGPDVWTIDPVPTAAVAPHVHRVVGYAENLLHPDWSEASAPLTEAPIGFAWLDGWDFPYDGVDYTGQEITYAARGQDYSQEASRQSHLTICQRIADRARIIAFDDSWRTHAFLSGGGVLCAVTVPPATYPAPALAMDQPYPGFVQRCGLPLDHPHHNDPDRGWDGKGGEAIPWLLNNGFRVLEYGLGLVVLEKGNDPA